MSEMGFLNDLGLDNVEADPNYIADGKYPAYVYESKVTTSKAGKRQWMITYKLENGKTQTEWKPLEFSGDPTKISQQKSFLKQRVLSLGVPESRVSTFQPGDVVGTAVTVQIKHKDGYQNVGTVEVRDTNSGGSVPSQTMPQASSLEGLL